MNDATKDLPNPDAHPLEDDFAPKMEENIRAILEKELGPHLGNCEERSTTPLRDAVAKHFIAFLTFLTTSLFLLLLFLTEVLA